jgi:hypothetical protein
MEAAGALLCKGAGEKEEVLSIAFRYLEIPLCAPAPGVSLRCKPFSLTSVPFGRCPSSPQLILTSIAESPTDVGYWSDEWRVGEKFGAKIRFGSFCVTKPLLNFLLNELSSLIV